MVGQKHGDNVFDDLLIFRLVNEQRPQRTVKHDLDHLVNPLKLVATYGARADPLRDAVLLAHRDDFILELRIIFDYVLAPERPSLIHGQQTTDHVIEFLAQRHEVEVERLYQFPVLGLQHVE